MSTDCDLKNRALLDSKRAALQDFRNLYINP